MTRSSSFTLLCVFSLFLIITFLLSTEAVNYAPEQIHISYTGNPDQIDSITHNAYGIQIIYTTGSSVDSDYTVYTTSPNTEVWYGTSHNQLNLHDVGSSKTFNKKTYTADIHTVVLTQLEPNQIYYYCVGDKQHPDGVSQIFQFSTGAPSTYAIFGDYGLDGIQRSIEGLTTLASNYTFQAMFHLGDIAYDLHKKDGYIGDQFLKQIQPITATMPYIVAPGNHESHSNFSHYLHRFPGLSALGKNSHGSRLWYSFNQHLVHFIVFDSEVYDPYPDPVQQKAQLTWLETDLQYYNTPQIRRLYPWIITISHKCDWQDLTDFSGFRPLLQKYGVDIHFCGHQHNYQRLYPGYAGTTMESTQDKFVYTNPTKYTQIVVGSPGCKSHIGSHLCPYDKGLANFALAYGFGLLHIVNATHLMFDWVKTSDPATLDAEDDFTAQLIQQQQHLITPASQFLQRNYPRVLLDTTPSSSPQPDDSSDSDFECDSESTSDSTISKSLSKSKKHKKDKKEKDDHERNKTPFRFEIADHLLFIQNHHRTLKTSEQDIIKQKQEEQQAKNQLEAIHNLSPEERHALDLHIIRQTNRHHLSYSDVTVLN